MSGQNAYFDSFVAMSGAKGFPLRSQAEIDSYPEKAQFSDRQPIVYDPVADAALLRFFPKVSMDIRGRDIPIEVTGTFTLTWDFKFDESFRWIGPGYVARHKTWRHDPGSWTPVRTDYRHAATKHGKFAEVFVTSPSPITLVPGKSWRQKDDPNNPLNHSDGPIGETLQPRVGAFYFEPNTWTRIWEHVEDFDKDPCYLSVWVADEQRDAVQLYDRIALRANGSQYLTDLFIEFDSSADSNPNSPITDVQRAWTRNVALVKGLALADVLPLLQKPVA